MVRSENKQEEKSMQDKHYLDDWIHVPICQKGDKLYHYTCLLYTSDAADD